MENQLFELTRKRRSIRRYLDKKISDDVINEIMKVALTAPTSFGHKTVEFVVVRDKETIRRIGECNSLGGSQVNGADTVVVTIVKTANRSQAEFWKEDGAIASTYILLAAEQYNIGACWIHLRNCIGIKKTSDEEIKELLKIPSTYSVLNLVTLGEKGEPKKSYTEDDLDMNLVHCDVYKK